MTALKIFLSTVKAYWSCLCVAEANLRSAAKQTSCQNSPLMAGRSSPPRIWSMAGNDGNDYCCDISPVLRVQKYQTPSSQRLHDGSTHCVDTGWLECKWRRIMKNLRMQIQLGSSVSRLHVVLKTMHRQLERPLSNKQICLHLFTANFCHEGEHLRKTAVVISRANCPSLSRTVLNSCSAELRQYTFHLCRNEDDVCSELRGACWDRGTAKLDIHLSPTITTSGYTELGPQHVKSHASKKGTMVALWHCARLYEWYQVWYHSLTESIRKYSITIITFKIDRTKF